MKRLLFIMFSLVLMISCTSEIPDGGFEDLPPLPALPVAQNADKELVVISFDDRFNILDCHKVPSEGKLSVCDCEVQSVTDTSFRMIVRGYCEMATPGRQIKACLSIQSINQVNSLDIQRDTLLYKDGRPEPSGGTESD